jgi:hypothetical protein
MNGYVNGRKGLTPSIPAYRKGRPEGRPDLSIDNAQLTEAHETLVDNDAVTNRSCEHGFAFACLPHLDGECFARKYWRSETTFNVLEAICIAATQCIQQATTSESVCAQTMQDGLREYACCNSRVIRI